MRNCAGTIVESRRAVAIRERASDEMVLQQPETIEESSEKALV